MTVIGYVLIMLGIGAIIEGWHGHSLWSSLTNLFKDTGPSTVAPVQQKA
jgi:hypothetical protein